MAKYPHMRSKVAGFTKVANPTINYYIMLGLALARFLEVGVCATRIG